MKIKSILTEIDNILPDKNKELIVENRASHVIVSANNVMQLLEKNYDADVADRLQKKFLNAIRTGKIERFSNALKRLENAD
jgi:hypothetical protein|tara:strand:+ start:6205 stop:6447 length:243 start_codon:yes stop_codon:yes gene_type:complete